MCKFADALLDHLYLVEMVLSWEQGCPSYQFCKQAANSPQIYRLSVAARAKYNLRGSVPASYNILRKMVLVLCVCVDVGSIASILVDASRETKVTDLEVAVRVDEQIARLDVPVHNVGRVHEKEAAQELVHEVLVVLI